MIQAWWLSWSIDNFNFLQSARSLPPYTRVNTRLQALLFSWNQEAYLPTKDGGPALTTVPESNRSLILLSKSENFRVPTEGGKLYLLLCG
jgi:hypothetical protein